MVSYDRMVWGYRQAQRAPRGVPLLIDTHRRYEKYAGIMKAGWPLTREDIERDARYLFADNFKRFMGMD